jgi:hypothetical protein
MHSFFMCFLFIGKRTICRWNEDEQKRLLTMEEGALGKLEQVEVCLSGLKKMSGGS